VYSTITIICLWIAFANAEKVDGNFFVMGDWGGLPIWPYYDPAENGIAKAMGKLATAKDAKMTLVLGDNFYTTGVRSVDDKRFKETFENVFVADSLQNDRHFRLLAGNHDHYGNVSAEVAYTNVSARWYFPSLYYDFHETIGNATLHIVMIDTVLLAGDSRDAETGEDLTGNMYTGPRDERMAESQWNWINQTVAESTADFLIVAGHFPVWSICEHGPTTVLVEKLKPILEANRVTAYLAGHDHCAQHIDEGKGVQYHGIGAGIISNPTKKHAGDIPTGSLVWHHDNSIFGELRGAFGHVSIDPSTGGLVVTHYESNGNVLYQASPIPPRN